MGDLGRGTELGLGGFGQVGEDAVRFVQVGEDACATARQLWGNISRGEFTAGEDGG